MTSYVGDVLAAVAAETPARRARGGRAGRGRVRGARARDRPVRRARPTARRSCTESGNVLSVSHVKRGDVDAALAGAAHVVTETFRTQFIEHAFLEPEAALAVPDGDGRCRVYSQGQGVWEDRRQIASFLGLPEEHVRVTQVSTGGAFGAKEDLNVQGHAALLAMVTGRPVLLDAVARSESLRFHSKRHPMRLEYTAGCDADGHLVALRARIVGDTGAYASVGDKVLERAAGHACGAYRVPNVDVEAPARSTRTTRRAARCAGSASTSRTSRWRACSTCSPSRSASTAGRSAGGTRSTWATVRDRPDARPGRRAQEDAARRDATPTAARATPGSPAA